jgi:hypothetical protein
MTCQFPPPLDEAQLSAAIDGAADAEVLEHLEGCASCRQRLRQAMKIEQTLSITLRRWDCPPSQQLGDYELDLLSGTERLVVESHLQRCARCQEELDELRRFLKPAREPAAPNAGRAWQRALVAQLLPASASALRGSSPAARIDLFGIQEGDAIITVQWRPGPTGTAAVLAQIADESQERWTGALVEFRREQALVATTMVDDLGGFSAGDLPGGAVEIRIIPASGQIVILPPRAPS